MTLTRPYDRRVYQNKAPFQGLDGRDVVGRFDGGEITSDAGGFHSSSERMLHRPSGDRTPVEALIKRGSWGCAWATRTSTIHDEFHRLLALLCDRDDLEFRRRGVGSQTAGKSTLNRLEQEPVRVAVQEDRGRPGFGMELRCLWKRAPPEELILV